MKEKHLDYLDSVIFDLVARINSGSYIFEIEHNKISQAEYNSAGEYMYFYTTDEDKILYHKIEVLSLLKKNAISFEEVRNDSVEEV